jgi:serine/threonine protein kinase
MTEEIKIRSFDKAGKGQHVRKIMRKRFNKATRQRVWQRTDGFCYLCKDFLPVLSPWHIEHVFAFSSDPASNDVTGNLLPSCATCNLKKSNKCLLECVTADGFSIMSTMDVSAMSLQPRVKRILLAAIALKCARRSAELPTDDAELQEWCEAADVAIESHLPYFTKRAVSDESVVAQGGQGTVWRAKLALDTRTRIDIAVKECNGGTCDVNREIEIVRTLGLHVPHPGLVKFYGVIEPDRSKIGSSNYCFLMELMDGDVHDARGASAYLLDAELHTAALASALRFLHELKIIHRDIKPKNVLYKKDPNGKSAAIKLADIGLARFANEEMSMGVGTGFFRAPEVKHSSDYTSAADIYSLGMTLKHLAGLARSRDDKSFLDELWPRCTRIDWRRRPSATELFLELGQDQTHAPAAPKQSVAARKKGVVDESESNCDDNDNDDDDSSEEDRDRKKPAVAKAKKVAPKKAPAPPKQSVAASKKAVVNKGESDDDNNIDDDDSSEEDSDRKKPAVAKAKQAAPKKAPAASAAKTVYVASISDKRGKYHKEQGCCGATNALSLSAARSAGRKPCSRCADEANATVYVYVTSKIDKRGNHHSRKDCYGASEKITLAEAQKDGRSKHC